MNNRKNRIVFYSKEDLSFTYNLKDAEQIIKDFESKKEFDLNDVIELYQIKLYFDNGLYLNEWSKETKEKFIEKVSDFWNVIKENILKIDTQKFHNLFDSIDYEYYDSFWELINIFNIYKNIDKSKFDDILYSNRFNIRHVLKQKNIVEYFSSHIIKYLTTNIETAEILLSYYEEEHLTKQEKLYFPSKLTEKNIEEIIQKYIENEEDANLNYVRLIVKSKQLKLSEKIKFNAQNLNRKLNEKFFDESNSWSQGVQVTLSEDQEEPIKISYDNTNNRLVHSYSKKYLDNTKNHVSIFKNFHKLFSYTNFQGCINLVSKSIEIDSFERTFMRSKNEFFVYTKFTEKSLLSQLQLLIYKYYLEENNIHIEDVLSYFINDYLNEKYNVNSFKVSFPNVSATYLEKIKALTPELESFIKQYKAFVEDDYVNFEFLSFSSSTLYLSKIESKLNNKYAYGNGDEFLKIKHCLFSSQSMLHYLDPFKNKYENLFELLSFEEIKYNSFQEYQKHGVNYLISQEYLIIIDGIVKLNNLNQVLLLSILHNQDVISYWHFSDSLRLEILELEKKGLITFESKLFTKEEVKYFNYYLNQKEFTNSLDLRNKYLHGTYPRSEQQQENDYNILLKLFILTIQKIEDDLALYKMNK